MMHRNLDRRIEVLVRLPETELVEEVGGMLDLAFDPATAAWELHSNGDWHKNAGTVDYQETLIERQRRRRTAS
jgi:polyphosphate kinase